ncbi:MAG: methyltransferase domain-containing protein [Methanoregula sp.]|jgi:SAM-dependent methyltransferase|uniref:small ribosomal subunit Rsm22 family protein n=1 Tax=Methanoregula sp. TaxID=2052170 RepID=UPI0025CEA1F2|nr:small ribosomal subunit Rsm22 family protein [Methanoregula sp.]MCK9630476.1 methyltransferase domain-containing protein [Methanoregula sp.]
MAGHSLITTVKYVAGTRPAFHLSEIIPYLDDPVSVDEIYRIISPELPRLGLTAKKTGDDVEISRVLPGPAYILNDREQKRIDTFLAGREIPVTLAEAIERYITKKAAKDWNDPTVIERLRKAITAQKDDYWKPSHKRSLRYTKGYRVLGYLAYHFPVYFMQTEHLLAGLARDGLLKKSMTILDVGTGPGVVPLAIADLWSRLDGARAAVYSIERSEEHIEAFLSLRDAFVPRGGPVSIKPPVKADMLEPLPSTLPEKFDLIIFSNVLNELPESPVETQAGIVERITERLAPEGTVLIIEPADEDNSTRMRTLTAELHQRGIFIHAPCSFIRGTPCTAPRCWSFTTAPVIRPTRLMEALARCEESYRYVNIDIKYSYAMLRKDGVRRDGYRVSPGSKFLRLSKLHSAVEKRVNVAVVKMSGELGDVKNHLFKVCDGTAKTPVYAVLPAFHMTPGNEALRSAPYGTVLEMRGVLVRYNKAHDAYNLLVSRNTEIQIPGADDQ